MIKDEKFWDELEVFHMPDDYTNNTITFSMEEVREADMKRILLTVYDALKEKGYNPISLGRPHLYHDPQQRPQPHSPDRPRRAFESHGAFLPGRVIQQQIYESAVIL